MSSFSTIGQLVTSGIESGRIGIPVAARLRMAGESAEPLTPLAIGIQAVCQWLRCEPRHIWSRRAESSSHTVAQVVCRGGQSLFVSVGEPGDRRGVSDLVVVGNRGIMAWEAGDDETVAKPDDAKPNESLLTSLQLALNSDHPVDVSQPRAVRNEATAPTSRAHPNLTKPAVSQPPLGILLVTGSHSHQENYALAYKQDSRCRLVGLTDEEGLPPRRRELNAQLAKELGIPLLDDFSAAIHREDVQIISICAAPERRARLIERCAAVGKHLYLDKPLAASVAQANAIVAAVSRGAINHQMFSLVHTSFAERVREVVRSGELGQLVAVHCDAFFAKGMPGTAADLSRPRRETARPTQFESVEAKRELHNVGVYSLVLLRWLLGREVRRVFANTCNYFFTEHQRLDMEDYAHVSFELDGGVLATVATGRTGWRSHAMGGMNRVVLVGTKKTVTVDWYKPRLTVWADEEPWQLPSRHPEDPMGFWSSTTTAAGAKPKSGWLTPADSSNDVRYFVDCVIAGRPSDVSAVDAAAVMEILMAAYESAATGNAVSLPLKQ